MHPQLNYDIAKLRHEELVNARRHPAPARVRRGLRGFLRRRRDTLHAVGTSPVSIVLLPPPREERDPAGHDQRVA